MSKLGIESGSVKLVPYNPLWAKLFLEERKLLSEHLKYYSFDIQHVGSTSVIGCTAKPVIDIAIGVDSLKYGELLVPILVDQGYIYRGDAGIPGRHFLNKNFGKLTTHHIHILDINGNEWHEMTMFRDYLNNNPELSKDYSDLKSKLENEHSNSRELYTKNKSPFIQEILQQINTNIKKE